MAAGGTASSWQQPSSLPHNRTHPLPLLVTTTASPFTDGPTSDSSKYTVLPSASDASTIVPLPSQPPSIATTATTSSAATKPLPRPSFQSSPDTLYYSKALPEPPTFPRTGSGTRAARTLTIDISSVIQTQAAPSFQAQKPTGTPRCIVRIDRDHDLADEATRFEYEQFPEEFSGRVTRPQFKATVEGINECMRDAEQSLLNCLDTLLDCLTAYTAKHCFGTHYQRAIRRMEEFIEQENKRLYHPARMHLRDPQKVGMIYLEFEVF
ncbi:MAG: Golgin subfamily A member 7/ERF4 family-domain-containing protein [Benniella sp.]|nr:MAG: Golgin subfamily A member 7/ERF4 family-domain-containing protein [Benniella sp.]